MLANICLRPNVGEESFRVIEELEKLGIDYDLDLSRGLIIFRQFSDWGKYINSSREVKSRIGDMNILWEGGTITTSHLLFPNPQDPLQIVSTRGQCKFNLSDCSLLLGNKHEEIWWSEVREEMEKKWYGHLESGKFIFYTSIFASLINLGVIREHYSPRSFSTLNAFIETFYNLKYLIRLPYASWKVGRDELKDSGFAIERLNYLEETIDVWVSETDFEQKLKGFLGMKVLIHLSSGDYKAWRSPMGDMFLWFKKFPEYIISVKWSKDTYYYRWESGPRVFKVFEHKMEEWKRIRGANSTNYFDIKGFVSSSHTLPLIEWSNKYSIFAPNPVIKVGEEKIVNWLLQNFANLYGTLNHLSPY